MRSYQGLGAQWKNGTHDCDAEAAVAATQRAGETMLLCTPRPVCARLNQTLSRGPGAGAGAGAGAGVGAAQSERAMQTAGDKQVPLGDAVHQQPSWIGDTFMH